MTMEDELTKYKFNRYVNGVLMAEGVTVERAKTFEEAMQIAARIASRGPRGDLPVLVLRTVETKD